MSDEKYLVKLTGGKFTIEPIILPVSTDELANGRSAIRNGGHSSRSRFLLTLRDGKDWAQANIPVTCLESLLTMGKAKLMGLAQGMTPPDERLDDLPVRLIKSQQYELSMHYQSGNVVWKIDTFDGEFECHGTNIYVVQEGKRENIKTITYEMPIKVFVDIVGLMVRYIKSFETVHFLENQRIHEEMVWG